MRAVAAHHCARCRAPGAGRLGMASHGQVTSFEAPRDLLDPAIARRRRSTTSRRSACTRSAWSCTGATSRPRRSSRVKPKFDATDPSAYDWSRYQPVLDEAKARGWSVLLTVSGPVPRWATNGARDTVTRPEPERVPHVRRWPSRKHFGDERHDVLDLERAQPPGLPAPAVLARGTARRRRGCTAASTSRRCAASPRPARQTPVLVGETAPRGTGKVVAPLTFLRGVLCLEQPLPPHTAGARRCRRPATRTTPTRRARARSSSRPGPTT